MEDRKKLSLSKTPQKAFLRRMASSSSQNTNLTRTKSGNSTISFIQAKFGHDSQDDSASNPLLINDLDKYTSDELKEYRQVFNMFDAGLFNF